MRLYDALRKGMIAKDSYKHLIQSGLTPDSIYYNPVAHSEEVPEYFHVTGTSTAFDTEVSKLSAQGSVSQNIVIKNTGNTNFLSIRLSYMVTGDIEYKSTTDIIAPNSASVYQTQDSVYAISTYIMDYVSGNHTTFELGCSLIY
jgi:hypothetical protein